MDGRELRTESPCFGIRSSSRAANVRGGTTIELAVRRVNAELLPWEVMPIPDRPFPAVRFSRLSAASLISCSWLHAGVQPLESSSKLAPLYCIRSTLTY